MTLKILSENYAKNITSAEIQATCKQLVQSAINAWHIVWIIHSLFLLPNYGLWSWFPSAQSWSIIRNFIFSFWQENLIHCRNKMDEQRCLDNICFLISDINVWLRYCTGELYYYIISNILTFTLNLLVSALHMYVLCCYAIFDLVHSVSQVF